MSLILEIALGIVLGVLILQEFELMIKLAARAVVVLIAALVLLYLYDDIWSFLNNNAGWLLTIWFFVIFWSSAKDNIKEEIKEKGEDRPITVLETAKETVAIITALIIAGAALLVFVLIIMELTHFIFNLIFFHEIGKPLIMECWQ